MEFEFDEDQRLEHRKALLALGRPVVENPVVENTAEEAAA